MPRIAMPGFTPREEKLLKFIEQYQLSHGASPTVREMRQHMRLKSDGFIIYLVEGLERKKAISKNDNPRGIQPLPKLQEKLASEVLRVPVLGYVPAGGPVLTEEFVEDWISIDPATTKHKKDVFFLKVKGESMMDAGIFDGDYAMVSGKNEPKERDVVIALIGNENTVKRFMKDKFGRPYLKAENPRFSDIHPGPGETLQIQGVVIGLLRWYQ